MRREFYIGLFLAAATILIYGQVADFDFTSFDDGSIIFDNPNVRDGLTLHGIGWAFSTSYFDFWHPLTWLSHMLDCTLFGLDPGSHHLVNLGFHVANSLLLFEVLQRMSGAWKRSAMVAALFALHPLHVESVAWLSERKDTLSTFFFLLTLLFYARFARGIKSGSNGQVASEATIENTSQRPSSIFHLPSSSSYYLALMFFALGLMSKPMLVTVPFVLLLLDYWPLKRFTIYDLRFTIFPLTREKLPYFGLSVISCVVTFMVQRHGGAVKLVQSLPPGARIGNALISYCRYLGKLFWPVDLAVFYPLGGHWPAGQVALAGGLLLGITVLLIVLRGRYPFMLMGWLWFGGTLVPVIGLVQVGDQAMADRYTYIPSLGVLILAIWGAYELARSWRYQVLALSVAGGAAIVLCLGLTRQQLGYWRDSETLYRHALEITENNYLAHNNLGIALDKKDQADEAIGQFREAIRLKPNFVYAYYNLGNALEEKGRTDEAISQFREAIRLKPDYADAHNNLGSALLNKDQIDEAISQFREAIRLAPDDADDHNNLGSALGLKGQIDEAISQFREAIRLNPAYAESHYGLGTALGRKGQTDEAIRQFREAIRLKPDFAEACNNLGTGLLNQGQIDEAISQYQKAIRLKPDYAEARNNLARVLEMKNAPAGR